MGQEKESVFFVPKPIYYKGWVIQPSFYGYSVSDRADHNKDSSMRFDTASEAYQYIDKKTRR